jgi:hypothetical protein
MVKLAKQFLGHVVPGVIRPLHVLWNEIIGFLFIVIAAGSIPAVVRSFRDLDKPAGSLFRLFVSVFFALVMLYFGVTSFLKARKIGRS